MPVGAGLLLVVGSREAWVEGWAGALPRGWRRVTVSKHPVQAFWLRLTALPPSSYSGSPHFRAALTRWCLPAAPAADETPEEGPQSRGRDLPGSAPCLVESLTPSPGPTRPASGLPPTAPLPVASCLHSGFRAALDPCWVPERSLIGRAVRAEGGAQDLAWPRAWHIVGAQQTHPQPHAATTPAGL